MSLIQVSNLTFAYDGSYDAVFDNVSFQIDSSWKLGFIGRNGRGKTTFLRLLMGQLEYSGKIASDMSFQYFPFLVPDITLDTEDILRSVCPQAENWEILRELSLLEVAEDVLYRPFATLSNGERTKTLLAGLFLNASNFLLIDEPTNHLDKAARDTVARYLQSKTGFILVSHDRHFLDSCIDHVLSINKATIEVQRGNFGSWLQNKTQQDNYELQQNQSLKKDITRLAKSAKRTGEWSDKVEGTKFTPQDSGLKPDRGHIGHLAAKMMKRSKSIQRRQSTAIEEKSNLLKNIETSETLKLSPLTHHSARLAEFSNVSVFYGEKQVCENISFTVHQGERIALSGKNGCGKSSLLRLLLGEDVTYTGDVFIASGLKISYVSQQTSHLFGNLSSFAADHNIDESRFKAILRKLDFSRVQFEKDMQDFSEGQKKKVLLARSLCEEAHLYIWDEPLNYIDVLSRMQIEALLKGSNISMLFVEHDSFFCTEISTKTALI